ncbi:MAG: tetratricopeptide repeat protein [Methanomicrobiales archaeon]|nr:tetratricopeptide repeat protein [Methanomicrobiales archaeon]
MTTDVMEEIMNRTDRIVTMIDPNVHILIEQANEKKNHGELSRALQIYDEALKIDPVCAGALCLKGDVLDVMGRLEDAVSCYDSALESDPCNAEIWYNKGITLKKMGKKSEADTCMQNALSLAVGKR